MALEISLQPVRILDVDAAIVFADIMLPAEGMGFEIEFAPGPVVHNPIRSGRDVEALEVSDPYKNVSYVLDTIKALRQELTQLDSEGQRKAVIGFAGAPWTLACYLLDQGPFKHFHGTQVLAKKDPQMLELLLDKLCDCICNYLVAQHECGADAVQLFDTWAGNLSAEDYQRFALPHTIKIFESLKKVGCPCTLYINGSSHLLPKLKLSGADCISVDWRTGLTEASEILGDKIAIQGNLDPSELFGPQNELKLKTSQMLNSWQRSSGYIVNLGHGILPTTPRENAIEFINTAKQGWSNR